MKETQSFTDEEKLKVSAPTNQFIISVKGWKGGWKAFHVNKNEKKARVAILASDKTDFKRKTTTRDKKGHLCIMIKESMQQEDKTIVNRYIHLRRVHTNI